MTAPRTQLSPPSLSPHPMRWATGHAVPAQRVIDTTARPAGTAGATAAAFLRLPRPVWTCQAATSDLRGLPRARFRGTTSPRRNNSPPQTPHGSLRSTAPARQIILTGQSPHSDFASSTSSGDSAKNRSGSSAHGSVRTPVTSGSTAGLTAAGLTATELTATELTTATRTGPPISVTCTNFASAAIGPSSTAAVPGRYMGAIPFHLLVAASLIRLTKRWPRMTKAADPISGSAALGGSWPVWLRPDPSPDADPWHRQKPWRYGSSGRTS